MSNMSEEDMLQVHIAKERQTLWTQLPFLMMMLLNVASANATRSIDLIPHDNLTVFQNDTPAIFYCYGNGFGTGAIVTWTLNGTGYSTHHAQRGITVVIDPPTEATVSSRLSIPSNSTINNNTQVVCRTSDVTLDNRLTSQPVNLTIQGLLDAPSNFYANISNTYNTTFLLSWGAPFSFDVTNSPDIFYYILCNNITIYGCRTIPSDPDCPFPRTCTSSVDFTYPSLNGTNGGQNKTIMDYGDPIQFTFFAVNGAGNGTNITIMLQPLKRDADEKLPSTSQTETRSIHIVPTSTALPSNEKMENSNVILVGVLPPVFTVLLLLIISSIVLVVKYYSTKRKPSCMLHNVGNDVPEHPENVEIYSYATHHEKSPPTDTTTTKTSNKSGYMDVVCHPIVSIPAPRDEVLYSEVITEPDSRWCHQSVREEEVAEAQIATGVDLAGKNESKSRHILSEDTEYDKTDYFDIKPFETDCNPCEEVTLNDSIQYDNGGRPFAFASSTITPQFKMLSPSVFIYEMAKPVGDKVDVQAVVNGEISIVVCGKRGTGKSSLPYGLLENKLKGVDKVDVQAVVNGKISIMVCGKTGIRKSMLHNILLKMKNFVIKDPVYDYGHDCMDSGTKDTSENLDTIKLFLFDFPNFNSDPSDKYVYVADSIPKVKENNDLGFYCINGTVTRQSIKKDSVKKLHSCFGNKLWKNSMSVLPQQVIVETLILSQDHMFSLTIKLSIAFRNNVVCCLYGRLDLTLVRANARALLLRCGCSLQEGDSSSL